MMQSVLKSLSVTSAICLLSACGGSSSNNQAPEAVADVSAESIQAGESVTFDASRSSDSDGEIVGYSWMENGVVLSDKVTFVKKDFCVGEHTVTLTVKDNDGATDSMNVTVSVDGSNLTLRPLKKTGQTESYDMNGETVTDGSLKDDGYYQAGVEARYTRDDTTQIVTDHTEGLQWQDDEDVGNVTFPWLTQEKYDICEQNTSDPACYDTSGETAATYCAELTLDGGGWRLPTIGELMSIVDRTRKYPAIDTSVFRNVSSKLYWSSTTHHTIKDSAWCVGFKAGYSTRESKDFNGTNPYIMHVRCVRDVRP